jgi:serine/threonine protein kinase
MEERVKSSSILVRRNACSNQISFLSRRVNPIESTTPGSTPAAHCGQPRDWVGRDFGPYRIIEILGEGGMGWVFKATDPKRPDPVALKVPRAGQLCSEAARKRIRQEILAGQKMPHRSVVRVFDQGEIDGVLYYTMEFIEGVPLNRWVAEEKPSLEKRIQIFMEICESIASFHKRDLTHRDLKPENLMLDGDGDVRILDFGLAKFDGDEPGHTASEAVLGSLHCMAPEQTGTGERPGKPADVYALGMIGYWLLTGQYPYSLGGLSEAERIQTIRHASPKRPSVMNRELNSAWDDILLRCLAKPATQRPATAELLLKEILDLEVPRSFVASVADPHGPQMPVTANPGGTTAPSGTDPGSTGESDYYIERKADRKLCQEIGNQRSIILICGPRHIGKTLALNRGLIHARNLKRRTAVTDCQSLSRESLESVKALYLELADQLAVDLGLSARLSDAWDDRRAPNLNLQTFIENHVLRGARQPVVWALDRVDRLFPHSVSASLFSLFRAWHNTRSTRPDVPWSLLTLILVYAAEDQELIADPNQSPFNVGERINIEDFTLKEAEELNARHGHPPPLVKPGEVQKLFDLVGGQPELLHTVLQHLRTEKIPLADFIASADAPGNPLERALQRLQRVVEKDEALRQFVVSVLRRKPLNDAKAFSTLLAEGVIRGSVPAQAAFRCELYRRWFAKVFSDSAKTSWFRRWIP